MCMMGVMRTEIVKISMKSDGSVIAQQEEIQKAGKILKEGGLVAFPTETVYGLGGNALLPEASQKIYAAKGRPSDNPLIVHISRHDAMEEIADPVPESARLLAERFWPGPLTMILKKKEIVPLETTGGLSTVAIREPSHPVACALIEASGGFVAAPSANLSGKPSPTNAERVIEDLSGRVDMILDNGSVGIGLESTIVDLTEKVPVILRPGFLTLEMVREVLPDTILDPGIAGVDTATPPKAPGMKYRHYAPKAPLVLVEGPAQQVIGKINALTAEGEAEGKKIGILATEETKRYYSKGTVLCIGKRADEESIARNLYECLRRFDELYIDRIYSETFPDEGLGQAIMNRLIKAAGHQVIEVS